MLDDAVRVSQSKFARTESSLEGAPWEYTVRKQRETLSSLFAFGEFFFWYRFWGLLTWVLWIGGTGHPGLDDENLVKTEVFNVGGWLTHGDHAGDVDVDFLVVVRQECSRLRMDGTHSVWLLAYQRHSEVGQFAIGLLRVKGAMVSLLTFATSQFKVSFEEERVVRAVLLLNQGRCVVVYGCQEASHDPEALAKTGHLSDAMLGELAGVACGQPKFIFGDINVGPNLIPCLLKRITSGIWVDLEEAWACAGGKNPSVTCKRCLGSTAGSRRDFMFACPLAAASLISCEVMPDRWVQPHFAVRAACG